MSRNSSPLDVPKTPPCSMRTTNRPIDESTTNIARECPTVRRRTSRISTGAADCEVR